MVFSANFLLPTLPLLNISSQLENTHNNDFFFLNGFSLSVINQNKQWGSLKGLSAGWDEGRCLWFILLLESTKSVLEIPYREASRRRTERIKDLWPTTVVVFFSLCWVGLYTCPWISLSKAGFCFLPPIRPGRESPSDRDEEMETPLS